MTALESYVEQELMWSPSRNAKRTYELVARDQTLATLTQPSLWREKRVGESAEGAWTFARMGVWRPRIVIADANTGAEVATLERSAWSGKGTLTLPDGRSFAWRSGNLWQSKWVWLDEADQPVMRFRQLGTFRTRCGVTIDAPSAEPHLMLLAMLGWFLMLVNQADAAAATSATIGAGV